MDSINLSEKEIKWYKKLYIDLNPGIKKDTKSIASNQTEF